MTKNLSINHLNQLLQSVSKNVSVTSVTAADGYHFRSGLPMAGFGVHCDVISAVGTADVDPAHRTYSSFQRGSSQPLDSDQMAYPVQVQAFRAIADFNYSYYTLKARDASEPDSSWVAAHFAIGLLPYLNKSEEDFDSPQSVYDASRREYDVSFPALTPVNLTNAMYKLLGESVIALMGPGTHNSSYGDLYALKPVKYLKSGSVDWQIVLALLSLWTMLFLSASIWMAFQRRWASSLSGFEFFKFGAQYPVEVNNFSSSCFEQCTPLSNIPGMVGSLSVKIIDGDEGFIGLSNRKATMNGTFVYDREKSRKDP